MNADDANGQLGVRQIGSATVDFDALTIVGAAGSTSLEPKVMAVLHALAVRAPAVVSRQTLIDEVWTGESGGDESLSRAISLLRKAFGDSRGRPTHIETIPRRGYRLVASVAAVGDDAAREASANVQPRRWLPWLLAPVLSVLVGLAIWMVAPLAQHPPPEGAPPLSDRSIAVLPFADLSPGGDQAYFADGLAEEILNALAGVTELEVAGRTSSFAYRGQDVDVRTIGQALGVRHVLEGSVRKAGNDLRITAQLVRTDDGYRRWSQSFDGTLDRVFDLQEQIAREIADALEVALQPAGSERLAPALTHSQAAYDAFLQGRSLARRFGAEEKVRAAELLEQAVAIDPGFALAWAELARTELFVPISNPDRDYEPHVTRARQAVAQALSIDPDLAMAHLAQGLIHEYDLDFAAALDALATAHRLDPGDPFLTIRYGYYLALIGRIEDGFEVMAQGLRLDPTDAVGLAQMGIAHWSSGDLEQARQFMQRSYDLGFAPVAGWLTFLLAQQDRQQEALELWQAFGAAAPGRYVPELETAQAWGELGEALRSNDAAALERMSQPLVDYLAHPDARANTYRLLMLVAARRPAEAMRLFLEKPYPINAAFVFPIWIDGGGFSELRRHPDFPAFAERIGLVDAWNAHGWPARCRQVPQLEAGSPAFRCD